MSARLIRRLFEHQDWADRAVEESLASSASPPEEALELYAHVLGAELVWLERVRGMQVTPVWPEADLAACRELAQRSRDGYRKLLDGVSEEALSAPIAYRNSAGADFESTLEDILLHVALHGTYHRGQVARILRSAGAAPASTDYIAFVRGAPAATREDAGGP